ncbi:hypothetical protein ERO13_A08G181800v2 [Gossypium hirsutum]|uniref:Glutathione S-transferase theta-1 isoform X1 n=3 Tax=Gossypium TaxID=3633 RepID=A0ABM2YK13_GOSHI|nr:glutathione S-transferase theta-1 isoform X1 [Gossypium hirsutum]KAG4188690.1 hypothetical protein ERO13_A08G181800v2 [Gossypium hirsutum]
MANSLCFTSFNTCNTAGILINPTKALVVNQALKSSRSARIRSLEAKAVEKNPTTIVYARCEGDAKREARKEAQSRTGKMKLEVYADRMSQPSRAVIIFCKVNGIDYTELKEDTSKREHLTPEFAEINPMKQLPAIVDGKFKLFESHSILIYLACAFPGVADHWYPADLFKRSKIHSVLYWHHSNLRRAPQRNHTNFVTSLNPIPSPKQSYETLPVSTVQFWSLIKINIHTHLSFKMSSL